MPNYVKILNLILTLGLLIGFIINLILLNYTTAFTFLVSFIFSLLFLLILSRLGVRRICILLVNASIWVQISSYYFYTHLQYYDKAFHFFNSILITLILCDIAFKHFKARKEHILIMVFLGVLGLLALWEIYEYFEVIFFNIPAEGVFNAAGTMILSRIDDTMLDIIVGGVGSLCAVLIKALV